MVSTWPGKRKKSLEWCLDDNKVGGQVVPWGQESLKQGTTTMKDPTWLPPVLLSGGKVTWKMVSRDNLQEKTTAQWSSTCFVHRESSRFSPWKHELLAG